MIQNVNKSITVPMISQKRVWRYRPALVSSDVFATKFTLRLYTKPRKSTAITLDTVDRRGANGRTEGRAMCRWYHTGVLRDVSAGGGVQMGRV